MWNRSRKSKKQKIKFFKIFDFDPPFRVLERISECGNALHISFRVLKRTPDESGDEKMLIRKLKLRSTTSQQDWSTVGYLQMAISRFGAPRQRHRPMRYRRTPEWELHPLTQRANQSEVKVNFSYGSLPRVPMVRTTVSTVRIGSARVEFVCVHFLGTPRGAWIRFPTVLECFGAFQHSEKCVSTLGNRSEARSSTRKLASNVENR